MINEIEITDLQDSIDSLKFNVRCNNLREVICTKFFKPKLKALITDYSDHVAKALYDVDETRLNDGLSVLSITRHLQTVALNKHFRGIFGTQAQMQRDNRGGALAVSKIDFGFDDRKSTWFYVKVKIRQADSLTNMQILDLTLCRLFEKLVPNAKFSCDIEHEVSEAIYGDFYPIADDSLAWRLAHAKSTLL